MAIEKDASVHVGVDGADDVARAAGQALDPWKRAGDAVSSTFRRAGVAITEELGSVARDSLRTLTALNSLSFGRAIESAVQYRETTARLATAAGDSIDRIQGRLEVLSDRTLQTEPALASWSKAVGRVTYDYSGALTAAKGLSDEAVATGKSFDEMAGLGKVLHNSLGVVGDTSNALGTIRSQADALGTIGGAAAFQDQLEALGSTLSMIAVKGDESRSRLTGVVGVLGKGLQPEAAQRAQAGALGALQGNALDISRTLGHDILDEQGHIKDPAKVIQDLKRSLQRRGLSKDRQLLAFRRFAGAEAGSRLFHGDFSEEELKRLSDVRPSTKAADTAEALAKSEAGKGIALRNQIARNQRKLGEQLAPAQEGFAGLFADHPLLGKAAELGLLGGGGALVKWGSRALAGLIGGGGTTAATGGATTAATGAAATTGASTAGVIGGGGGLSALGAVLLPLVTQIAYGFAWVKEAGQLAKVRPQIAVETASALETHREGNARALVRAAERSGGTLEGYVKETGPSLLAQADYDPALKTVAQGLTTGIIDLKDLPQNIARAIRDELESSPLKASVVLQNDSDHPVKIVTDGKKEGKGRS